MTSKVQPSVTNAFTSLPIEDIANLRDVFETLLQNEHVAHRAAADLIAKRVMQLYGAGVRNRAVFLAIGRARKKYPAEIYLRGTNPH